MVASLFVWKNLDLRPQPARFPGNDRADAIDGDFIVRWRFSFHETFEE